MACLFHNAIPHLPTRNVTTLLRLIPSSVPRTALSFILQISRPVCSPAVKMEPAQKRPRLDLTQKPTKQDPTDPRSRSTSPRRKNARQIEPALLKSPFQLTRIKDLPEELNRETVTLNDILGDPLITEFWNFNFMHDVDFIMNAVDADTRGLVKVHLVHGYWKREDPSRLLLQNQASRYSNVTLHAAFMPEMFGTHHSKMMILFRNDDTAQVIIHTANTIEKDWTNMTNGVWKSPILPLIKSAEADATQSEDSEWEDPEANEPSMQAQSASLPSVGERFKQTLLHYLRAYDAKKVICGPLATNIAKYDFSAVRAVLIASVPGRHPVNGPQSWGWLAMKQALKNVPTQDGESVIVAQISSIATLGANPTWLHDTLFTALSSTNTKASSKPRFKVVFPTAEEIRRSLDGYVSGGSIHTKIQSAQQEKQLQYLRPIFCHWANDSPGGKALGDVVVQSSGRDRAAPHIKTYIRYGRESIDWALLTSANLSKQAWGEAVNKSGEVRIASWEIGVLVWPEMLTENADTVMVETFKSDAPTRPESNEDQKARVGLRIPYSLPLQGYKLNETPWVATMPHSEPDHLGRSWLG